MNSDLRTRATSHMAHSVAHITSKKMIPHWRYETPNALYNQNPVETLLENKYGDNKVYKAIGVNTPVEKKTVLYPNETTKQFLTTNDNISYRGGRETEWLDATNAHRSFQIASISSQIKQYTYE